MAITNLALQDADAQTIFTSTGSNGDIITLIYLCNTDVTWQTANLFVVGSFDVPDPALNIVYSNVLIQAGDTLVIETEKIVFGVGDYLAANCSNNNSVIATVSSLAV